MKRKICLFLLSILCILPTAGAQNHFPYWHQRVALFDTFTGNQRKDVVLLGDSITNGCEWFELFGNRRVKNRGINGDTSVGVYDRLPSTLAGQPAKVFLMIGTNDLANGAPVDSVARMMERIIARTKELSPRTKLYVQSLLPVNDAWHIFVAHMGQGAEDHRAERTLPGPLRARRRDLHRPVQPLQECGRRKDEPGVHQ